MGKSAGFGQHAVGNKKPPTTAKASKVISTGKLSTIKTGGSGKMAGKQSVKAAKAR